MADAMHSPSRIKPMLTLLETIWNVYPDMRLGQLVSNFAATTGGNDAGDPFQIEDEDLEDRFKRFLASGKLPWET